jgi:DNA-binding transcriptional MerR regulator
MGEDMISTGKPIPAEETKIPDKLYFRIGEVAQLAGVEPYVLRFWESEFPQLAPKKSGSGHRLYRRKEVEMVLEVKRLLYDKRFTIEGARRHFEQTKKKGGSSSKTAPAATPSKATPEPPMQAMLFGAPASPPVLEAIKKEISSILDFLKQGSVRAVR